MKKSKNIKRIINALSLNLLVVTVAYFALHMANVLLKINYEESRILFSYACCAIGVIGCTLYGEVYK